MGEAHGAVPITPGARGDEVAERGSAGSGGSWELPLGVQQHLRRSHIEEMQVLVAHQGMCLPLEHDIGDHHLVSKSHRDQIIPP